MPTSYADAVATGKATGKPLPPGTPVEIPDPGNPGKKIYFKVP